MRRHLLQASGRAWPTLREITSCIAVACPEDCSRCEAGDQNGAQEVSAREIAWFRDAFRKFSAQKACDNGVSAFEAGIEAIAL